MHTMNLLQEFIACVLIMYCSSYYQCTVCMAGDARVRSKLQELLVDFHNVLQDSLASVQN